MNIIIFDTETATTGKYLLNIGYRIVDMNPANGTYKELLKRDILISEVWNNTLLCEYDMFVGLNKVAMYNELIANGSIKKHTIKKAFDMLAKDLNKYKCLFGYAYNCDFDLGVFSLNAERYAIVNPLADLVVYDIWQYARKFICETTEYQNWAKDNGQLTETKRFISTNVESVTRYLEKNLDFVEDHTALSDTKWETKILAHCISCGCDITKPLPRGKNIESGYVFNETIITPDGQVIELSYTNKITRNGKTTFKK